VFLLQGSISRLPAERQYTRRAADLFLLHAGRADALQPHTGPPAIPSRNKVIVKVRELVE
jgi:hypothetical protein